MFSLVFMGNKLRGDDGVGVLIGEKVLELFPALRDHCFIVHNSPANYLGAIIKRSPTHILFIDAVDLQAKPGIIILSNVNQIPPSGCITTHYQDFKELLRFLELELPVRPRSMILGVQIKHTDYGEPLSAEVSEKVKTLAEILVDVSKEISKEKQVMPR